MQKVILKIKGMSCSACQAGLEKYLNKQSKIKQASVNLVLAQALIEYEDDLTLEDLNRFVKEAGYESLGIYNEKEAEKKENQTKQLCIYGIFALLILYISMGHMFKLPAIFFLNMEKYPINYALSLLILTIPFLIYGLDIIKSGIKNLLHKMPNMDTLVTIGILSSFFYSVYGCFMILNNHVNYTQNLYFESCAIIIFFIKLGRNIDKRSKEKTKQAIKELVQITPSFALLKTEGKEKKITIDEVKKGDILIAKPGMKIAVDGTITFGNTHIEESFITGESLPVKKGKKDKVIAGTINEDGYIEYKAERIGKDSTISEIVRLVVEATNTKAPIARVADILSSYFVPSILLIAILTFIGYLLFKFPISIAMTAFVNVLVIACPCALGLATPLAIVISEGWCAKKGILVKTSEILENAHKVDTIVFDKTGTLTYGNLKIAKLLNYSDFTDKEVLQKVCALEKKSTHPIAKAFTSLVEEKKLKIEPVSQFKNLPGIGIWGSIHKKEIYVGNSKLFKKLQMENKHKEEEEKLSRLGNSIVYVIEDCKLLALIGVKDVIKKEAEKTIKELKQLGKEIIMLTGDNEQTAKIIANEIGIEKVIANVMPKEKTKIIKNLMQEGKKVMMVGDGINDAPSLASANIGVSVNNKTDIAADSADVIFMQDDLGKMKDLIDRSHKTIKNIKQNLFWAFFYNVCMIPLAIGFFKPLGLSINPMFSALAMTMSSLTVVFNALRLRK